MLGVFAFLLGASIGSFLNLSADRVPEGRSVVRPGSFCEACSRPLGKLDLVPILSYLWLRGKCRHCGTGISFRIVVVEAVTGLLFLAVYLRHGFDAEFFVLAVAVSLLIVVALIDLERGLILNRMMYPSIAVLIILSPFWNELGFSRSFLGDHTMVASSLNTVLAGLGSFLVFLAIAVIYPQGMGGGDIKLSGVVGLLVGFPGALAALWIASVTGGVVAIGLLLTRKLGRKDMMPFGPFLALGAAAALLVGDDITAEYNNIIDFLAGE